MEQSSNKSKVFIGLFLAAIFGLIAFISIVNNREQRSQKTKAAGTPVSITLSTSKQTVNPGEEIVITATLDTKDRPVSAAELDFEFPADSFDAISIKEGVALPLKLPLGQGKTELESGKAHIVLAIANPATPYTDLGTVAILTLKAKSSPGAKTIALSTTSKVAATDDLQNNALGVRGSTTVTIDSNSQTTDGVVLSLIPASSSVTVGNQVSVDAMLSTGSDAVTAAELNITYDANKLQAQTINAGSALPVVLKQAQINSGVGSITVGVQPSSETKGFTGNGAAATVTFTTLNVGTANIDFATSTSVAAIGKSGNVLSKTNGTTVSVAAARTCPTDVSGTAGNADGKVDIHDYNVVLGHFGQRGPNLKADFDKDGDVDIFDYNEHLTNFGCNINNLPPVSPTVKPSCSVDSDCNQVYCINPPCPQNRCVNGTCQLVQTTTQPNATPTRTPTPTRAPTPTRTPTPQQHPTGGVHPTTPPPITSAPPQGQFPGGVYPNAAPGWIPVSYQGWSVPASALGGQSTRDFVFGENFHKLSHWHFDYNLPNTCGNKVAINSDTQLPVTLTTYNDNSAFNMCRIQSKGDTYQQHTINLPPCQSGTGVNGEGRECVTKDKCVFTLRASDFKGSTELRLTPNSPNSPAAGNHRWYLSTNFQTKPGYRSNCQLFARDENCGAYHRTIISNYDKLFASGEPIPTVRGTVPIELEFNGGCGSFSRSLVFANPNQHVGVHGQISGNKLMDYTGDFKGTFQLDTTKLGNGINKILMISMKGSSSLVGATGIALLFNVQN